MYIIENAELMAEWNWEKNNKLGLDPEKLTDRSNKKVWWKCEKGHEWESTIDKSTHTKKRCPYCANRKVLKGFNDLKTLYPEIAKDWHTEKNKDICIEDINTISIKRVWWKCAVCGYEWQTRVRDRTLKGTGCRECAGVKRAEKKIKTHINRNGSLDNELLISEWNAEKNGNLKPNMFTKNSNKKVWWKCHICGYEWKAQINGRNRSGRGCPKCAGQVLIKGENDLETLSPELAREWNYEKNGELKPSDVRLNYHKKVWWKCPYGHEYQATPNHRNTGTNCPICNSGRQTSFAEQAVYFYLKKAFPDAINRYKDLFKNRMEVDIYIPSIKTAVEYDGVYWHNRRKISRQREKIKYELCQEQGIKLIRLREELPENNDAIADMCIHVANVEKSENLNMLIRHFLDMIDPRSNFWYRKDPRMIHSPISVDVERDRFEIMKYMQSLKANSLQELYPEIAMEWCYEKNGTLTPDKVTPGSDKRVWWKCKTCGNMWVTSIGRRTRGTKCPKCVLKHNRDNHYLAKKVFQYTAEGEFIKEWNSVSAAARELGISDSSIRRYAETGEKIYKGWIWRYPEE